MELKITIVTVILFFSFLSSIGISIYSLTKGYLKGQKYFTWLMVAAAFYALTGMLEASVTSPEAKFFWSKMEYFGVPFTPVLLLQFALSIKDSSKKLLQRIKILYLMPFIMIGLVWTNDYHHVVWKGYEWSTAVINILKYDHNWGWYIFAISCLIIILASILILRKMIPESPVIIKKQIRIIIGGCIAPLVLTVLYITELSPLPGLDLTIMSIPIMGVFFLIGIFRFGLFKVIPLVNSQITQIIQDGLMVLDGNSEVVFFNLSAAKIMGWKSNESTFKKKQGLKWLRDITESGAMGVKNTEIMISSNPERWLEISINKIDKVGSSFSGTLILMHDITKRKTLETQTRNLLDELKISHDQMTEAMKQKDRIISIIAHDLRTSFHQIMSLSDLLAEDVHNLSEDDLKVFLSDLVKASRQGNDILEELLNWAKSQKSNFSNLKSFLIKNSLNQIIKELSFSLQNKNLTVRIEGETDLSLIADQNILNFTLRNLIINAIKFSNKNSLITVSIKASDSYLNISVKDNGVGIPEQDLEKLFNPRIKYSRTGTEGEQGSGLGLLLCKEMIERSGGTIEVSSVEGQGSTFTIKLKKENNLAVA